MPPRGLLLQAWAWALYVTHFDEQWKNTSAGEARSSSSVGGGTQTVITISASAEEERMRVDGGLAWRNLVRALEHLGSATRTSRRFTPLPRILPFPIATYFRTYSNGTIVSLFLLLPFLFSPAKNLHLLNTWRLLRTNVKNNRNAATSAIVGPH